MKTKPGFICAQCGTAHEGYPTDHAYKLPDDVWAIPKSERETRAKFTTDLCKLGRRYFIRGILVIPLVQRENDFAWGVWAEIERSGFERYLKIYNADAWSEPLISGTLANTIPGYEDAANERVIVTFGSSRDRPKFVLQPHSTSLLAKEQRSGIDERRYHEMFGYRRSNLES